MTRRAGYVDNLNSENHPGLFGVFNRVKQVTGKSPTDEGFDQEANEISKALSGPATERNEHATYSMDDLDPQHFGRLDTAGGQRGAVTSDMAEQVVEAGPATFTFNGTCISGDGSDNHYDFDWAGINYACVAEYADQHVEGFSLETEEEREVFVRSARESTDRRAPNFGKYEERFEESLIRGLAKRGYEV